MDMKTTPLPEKIAGLRINGQRLWDSLMELAQIGATTKGGVCRLTLTDLDRQVRRQLRRAGRYRGGAYAE
jgi:N-carbamoyl-L-amino-acid hydrolase